MLPVALYIHMPWCIKKCPYCDFNSHKKPEDLPEKSYIDALLADLDQDLARFPIKSLSSIFIGGGTPSLFSAESYATLFDALKKRFAWETDMEITMEANPGTFEQQRFIDYKAVGINRLSLGIQSFNPQQLKNLGRIHDDKQAHLAIEAAFLAGFDNINLDIMHGLPNQTIAEGLADLKTALGFKTAHISWYQLTIEPNTEFHKRKPVLPCEDTTALLEEKGLLLLQESGYQRYEISAFTSNNRPSMHNMNYWLFGDYLGIGAGAHGKLSTKEGIVRTRKHKQPLEYLNSDKPFMVECRSLQEKDIIFEFMLNATRLEQIITFDMFETRTGLSRQLLIKTLEQAVQLGLIILYPNGWQITPFGRQYTNNLQGLFL